MKAYLLRSLYFFGFFLLPLAALASGHQMQGVGTFLTIALAMMALLVGVGFATKFLVWPSFSTFVGKVVTILLVLALLFVLAFMAIIL
jgi:hypothetical protein